VARGKQPDVGEKMPQCGTKWLNSRMVGKPGTPGVSCRVLPEETPGSLFSDYYLSRSVEICGHPNERDYCKPVEEVLIVTNALHAAIVTKCLRL
jgi:hypothetical protein